MTAQQQAKTDFSIFTHPRVLFAERVVRSGERLYIDQNELKTSRDFLVDWIWISESSLGIGDPLPAPANTNLLGSIAVNWCIADRPWWFAQDVLAAIFMQSHWDIDRTMHPFGTLWLDFENQVKSMESIPTFLWRHPLRWLYNPEQGATVEWFIPATGVGIGASCLTGFGWSGVGLETGHRRIFQLEWTFPQVLAGQSLTGTASIPATMHNLGDEPYLIETSHTPIWPSIVEQGVDADVRWLNQWRFKVKPTWADSWSDVGLPLLIYGPSINRADRDIWYKPPGGPILMKAGQSVNFRIHNRNGTYDTNVQVALVGRTAFGLGSMY